MEVMSKIIDYMKDETDVFDYLVAFILILFGYYAVTHFTQGVHLVFQPFGI